MVAFSELRYIRIFDVIFEFRRYIRSFHVTSKFGYNVEKGFSTLNNAPLMLFFALSAAPIYAVPGLLVLPGCYQKDNILS